MALSRLVEIVFVLLRKIAAMVGFLVGRAVEGAVPRGIARGSSSRPARTVVMGATGLEPVTPSLSSWCSPN